MIEPSSSLTSLCTKSLVNITITNSYSYNIVVEIKCQLKLVWFLVSKVFYRLADLHAYYSTG